MYIGISWETHMGIDIIKEKYGNMRLLQMNEIEDETIQANSANTIEELGKEKCSDDLFHSGNNTSKVNVWCFKNSELLKILRHGNSKEIQTSFQILLYRRGI